MFDSSRRRHEPFRFRVGDGQVIPGWELGVQKLSVGEKSEMTIPSELGYGPQVQRHNMPHIEKYRQSVLFAVKEFYSAGHSGRYPRALDFSL